MAMENNEDKEKVISTLQRDLREVRHGIMKTLAVVQDLDDNDELTVAAICST